jgi:LemA protein
MKGRSVGLGASMLAVAALGWGGVQIHRSVERLDASLDSQWSQVEDQLAGRHDLLPQLVPVALAHAGDDPKVFEELAAARTRYLRAPAAQRPVEARRVDVAFAELLLLGVRYADLEADQHFRDLRDEVAAAQDRIALERRRYNEQVALRNERIRRLPWRFFSGGREPRAFYDPPAEPFFDPGLDAGT